MPYYWILLMPVDRVSTNKKSPQHHVVGLSHALTQTLQNYTVELIVAEFWFIRNFRNQLYAPYIFSG